MYWVVILRTKSNYGSAGMGRASLTSELEATQEEATRVLSHLNGALNVECILTKYGIKTSRRIKSQSRVQKQMWPHLKFYQDKVCLWPFSEGTQWHLGLRKLSLSWAEFGREARVTVQARRNAGWTPMAAVWMYCGDLLPLKGLAIWLDGSVQKRAESRT